MTVFSGWLSCFYRTYKSKQCYKWFDWTPLSSTGNQILDVPLPSSSTFASRRINAGEIGNRGIELSLNVTPVKTTSGFSGMRPLIFQKTKMR